MKLNTKIYKAKFIEYNTIFGTCGYKNGGFVESYWFEIFLEENFTTILPLIFDYTVENWKPRYGFLLVLEPLWSYQKKKLSVENMIGTVCEVVVLHDQNGYPLRVESIVTKK